MRLTEFWTRMHEAFGGRLPAETFAQDVLLSRLGNRTVNQTLASGEDAKRVWTAVVQDMELPARLR
ncbi:MAG: DUF3046 domain-containing protein [Actinomycetota bacterium]|nr:DUF3046 domain-containing protein [Actinomycetota bacterium]